MEVLMHQKFWFYEKKVGTMMTVLFLVLFLGFFGSVTAQVKKQGQLKVKQAKQLQKALTLEKAKQLMIKKLYKGKFGNRALFANPELKKAGAKIASWRVSNKLTVDKESWFFFVDEQPGANWEHKASYVIVNKTTGAVKKVAAMTPPVEMLKLKALNPRATTQLQVLKKNISMIRARLVPGVVQLLKRSKIAVLVSGGYNASSNYARYWNDLQFIYKALKQKYHYTDSEIIVLYANGTHSPNADFDGDGKDDVDYAATKSNLAKAINLVALRIAKNGKFFFYATNHGGDDPGAHKSNLTLWGESIKDSEFAALTKKIKCANAIYVMEQCFSGGMMDDLLKAQTYPCTSPRVCVMTAAKHDEPSWSCDTEGQYDEYVYHWTSAVYGKTPGGTPVNADTNGDGAISMSEAHEYAKKKDSRNEHPVIGSCVTGASSTTLKGPLMIKQIKKVKRKTG
jgi:hypothetical protein